MRRLGWLCGVMACAGTPQGTLPAEHAAPPMQLEVFGLIQHNSPFGARVTGAAPNATVELAFSRDRVPGATCFPSGACVDLEGPRIVGSAQADSNGVANIAVGRVPDTLTGPEFAYLQALSDADVSQVRTQFLFVPFPGGEMWREVYLDDDWFDPPWTGRLSRSWRRGGEYCSLQGSFDAIGDVLPDCPSCSFSFRGTVTWRESTTSSTSDCRSMFGYDLAGSLPPSTIGTGMNQQHTQVMSYLWGMGWVRQPYSYGVGGMGEYEVDDYYYGGAFYMYGGGFDQAP